MSIKKIFVFISLFLSFTLFSCAGGPSSKKAAINFSTDVAGIIWLLESLQTPAGTTVIDHGTEAKADAYTLTFGTDGMLSGKAWPNRYSGPYTVDGSNISVSLLRSTMMLAFGTSPGIEEHEYYALLESAGSIALKGKKLVISCKGGEQLLFSVK